MKTDQNSNMQGTLDKRISMKKRRNAKRALLALNLVAVIFTTTVFSNPVSVLSEEVSTDAVQSIENNAGGDAQIAEQADVQQNTAEAAQAAEAPAAENSVEAAKAEEPSGVNAPAENAMSAEMNAAEDGVVSTDDGASSASAVQSADTSSASNGSFEDAGAGNTDGTKDGIIENDEEGVNEAEGNVIGQATGDVASQEQLTYEDEHVKISVSFTDGRAFPADSILNGTYLDSDEKNAVLSAVNTQISKGNSADTVSDTAENTESSGSAPIASTTATTVEYSVAGFHALMLSAKNQDGSDTTTEGDVTFSAEFKKGLNDAGYASREEITENNEAGGDGSLTTTTTRCETSWKIYTVTEKNLTDITDITDAHNTHYEMDENGTLKSASFRGALPQTVAFVQIVKKTVTETTTQKETEKAAERETESETDTETQKAKETEKITGTETEKVTEKTTERETDDVKEQVSSSAAMPAVTFDQKVTTDNGTVMVHVEAEEGAFEEGTSMTVNPVTSKTILDKAIDAAGGKGAAVAMDITFTKPDGTKTEPLKPIHVKMISPVLNHAEEAHVVHVADSGTIDVVARKSDGKTIESTSSEAASSDAKNAVSFESDSFSVYAIVYTVDFTYAGFTYNMTGNTSMQLSDLMAKLGVDGFDVSKVESVSFTDESLVKVEKNEDGDYTLTSLQSFGSDELLTVEMNDGIVYKVSVKDAQEVDLSDYLTGFTAYTQGSDGKWYPTKTVTDGDSVAFDINFKVPSGSLTSDQKVLTFDVSEGGQITLPANGSSGKVTQQGKEVGDYTIDANGKVTITLNDDYKTNVAFEGTLSFEGTVHNTGDNTGSKITFGTKDEVTVKPQDSSTDLEIHKDGGWAQSGEYEGYYKYVITIITHKGTKGDIDLSDIFSGVNSLTADQIKDLTITYNGKKKTDEDKEYDTSVGPDGTNLTTLKPEYYTDGTKGWHMTLPGVNSSPTPYYAQYTITYYAKLDASSSANGAQDVTNTAKAHDESHYPEDSATTHIRSSLINKSSSTDYTNKRINWTINVHQSSHNPQNLAGEKFKDIVTVDGEKIDTSNIYVLDDSGNKLPSTMYVKDKSGNYLKDTYGNKIAVKVNSDGSFTFPEGSWWDTDYYFEYSTDFPEGAKGTTKNVDNTVEYTHGGNTYTDHKNEYIEGTTAVYDVDKWYEANGYKEDSEGNSATLQWSSAVYLPEENITSDKVTYTDTLTAAGGNNYDTSLTGVHYTTPAQLKDIEAWTTTKDKQSGDTLTLGTDFVIYDMSTDPGTQITNFSDTETHITKFQVVFTEDGLKKLNTKQGGAVNFRYHTTASYKDQQAKTNWKFSNRGEIPGHHSDAEMTHYKNLTLEKLSSATGPDTKNLGGYYNYGKNGIVVDKADGVIYYRVTFYIPAGWDANTAVELTDTFPSGLTYKDGSVEARQYGSDDNITKQDGLTATASKPEDAGNGQTKVKFTVNGFQPGYTYMIYYQATFDQDSYWAKEDAKKKDYENKIEWNGHSDTTKTTVEKDAKVLKKDGVVIQEKDSDGKITGKGYITYHLTINPGAADLDSQKDTLTLTDTIGQDQNRESKLYIDTSTIKVYQYDPSMPNNMGSELNSSRYTYQYDEKTQKLTLTIPDQLACVVSYRYNFEAGKNDENITNNATLSGEVENKASNTSKVEGSTSKATTNQNQLVVYKVDSKDDKVRLKGVTFKLYEYAGRQAGATEDWKVQWNEVEFKDPDGNSKGTTKVTDENGEINFTTIDDGLKTNTVYKLVETSVGDNKGYSVSDKAMYFIFPAKIGDNENPSLNDIIEAIKKQYGVGSINGADNITLADGIVTYYFKDEQKNSIRVNKAWLNADGKDMNDPSLKATVRLKRKYQQDYTETTHRETVTVTLHMKDSTPHGQWNKNPDTVTKSIEVVKGDPDAKVYVQYGSQIYYQNDAGGQGDPITSGTYNSANAYVIPVGSITQNTDYYLIYNSGNEWDNWGNHANLYTTPASTVTTSGTRNVDERAKDSDGNDIPDVTLTSDTNWSHMWTDLPADKDGKPLYYYLEEVSVDGFDSTITNNGGIQAGTILVTNKSKTQVKHISFDFNKRWTDEAGNTAEWAKDITVTLSATPTAGGDTKSTRFTLHQNKDGSFRATKVADSDVNGGISSYVISGSQNEDGTYKLKFGDLPDGYTYSLTEDKVDGYNAPTYTSGTTANQGDTITNSPETATIDFRFSKKWSEGAWPDGVDSITFTLYKTVDGGEKAKVTDITVKKDGTVTGVNGYNIEGKAENNVTTVTIKDLPTKEDGKLITYTVEEGTVTGYTADKTSVGNGGTITNSPALGSLKITKNVTVNNQAANGSTLTDGTYYFTIKDTDDKNATGKVDGQEITNGEVSITISGGASTTVEVTDLPAGQYTITEETDKSTNKGVSLSSVDGDDEATSATVTVTAGSTTDVPTTTFTNNINTGDLKIEKQVDGAPDSQKDKEFSFEITLTPPTGITLAGKNFSAKKNGSDTDAVTVSDTNTVTVTLKANENFEIFGLPAGTTYEVTEDTEAAKINGYSLSTTNEGDNPRGEISKDEKDVKFKNTYSQDKTDFSFTKVWNNGGEDHNWKSDIVVTLTGKAGDSEIAEKFTITKNSDGTFTATSSEIKGKDKIENVVFEGPDADGAFKFSSLPKSKDGTEYVYTLTEEKVAGYADPEYSGAPADEGSDGIKTGGTVTNNKLGSLKLTKVVTVDGQSTTGTLADGDYTFTVKKDGEETGKTVVITIVNGDVSSAKVEGTNTTLEDGYVVLADLPLGTYTITESGKKAGTELTGVTVDKVNAEVSSDGVTVTLEAGDEKQVVFTNNLTTFSFTKTWKDNTLASVDWPSDVPSLTFTVTGTKGEETKEYTVEVTPATDNTAASVTVKQGENTVDGITGTLTQAGDKTYTVTLSGLSSDYTYKVTGESEVIGYSSEVSSDGKTVTNTQFKSFEFTKAWANADGTNIWKKDITVTLTGKPETGDNISATYTISKTDTGFSVTKAEGGSADLPDTLTMSTGAPYTFKFDNLPAGYEYTLTEKTAPGYNAPKYDNDETKTSISDKGTITNTESTFQFTKIWQNGTGFSTEWLDGQTLEFKVADENNNEFGVKVEYSSNKEFTVTVTKPEGDAYAAYSPTGKVEKTGKENDPKYQITIIGLPAGHTYKVTETTQVTGYDAPKYGDNGEEYAEAGGTITNKQTATYSLPATGGPGILGYIGGGLLLMLFALLLLYINKSHERRQRLS